MCATLTRRAQTYPWPRGPVGRNARDAYLAIVDRAREIDSLELHMSLRELGELAGFGRHAASTALHWLITACLLHVAASADKHGQARRIRLDTTPREMQNGDSQNTYENSALVSSNDCPLFASPDAHPRRARQPKGNAGDAAENQRGDYLALAGEPQTIEAVAAPAG